MSALVRNGTESRLRILFITVASHTLNQSDYNHFQRVDYLSRHAQLTLWACKGADFSASAEPGTKISRALFGGKAGLYLHSIAQSLLGRSKHFDIVLTEPSLISMTGLIAKLTGGGKWVVDVWDVPGRMGGTRGFLVRNWLLLNRFLLKHAFRKADLFLMSIRPDYEFGYFDIPAARMVLMKNAIRTGQFDAGVETPGERTGFKILCTRSTYHSDMGLDTIAEAYRLLRESGVEASLTIVGRIAPDVLPQVASVEGDPNVTFHGFIEKSRLMALIRASSVCVVPFKDVPDLAQTYPIKVLEYMAMAKPVVVSKIGGMAELIEDGVTGLFFDAGDPEDLCRKLRKLAENRALAVDLARQARAASIEHDYEVKGRRIVSQLEKLLS